MHEQPLRSADDAIDDALRDLMNVDADRAFQGRVLSRISNHAVRSRELLDVLLWSAAAGALILTIVLMRSAATAPESSAAPAQQVEAGDPLSTVPPRLPVAEGRDPTPPRVELGPSHALRQRATHRAPVVQRGSPPEASVGSDGLFATGIDDYPSIRLQPLPPLEPVAVPPIEPMPIMLEEISVVPLTAIADVQVEPLMPRSEWN
jgi:hypothetical protein